ncbi:hypothetical protein B0H13DRAFT_2384747 [Mycena leptocephala]|nr:hypothetical protein B0H13DRAFT_2384747 [Mycena leptocephala]
MARRPRCTPRVVPYFDRRKLQGHLDPFATLKNLRNPYLKDALGYVYIVRRVRRQDYERYRNGQTSLAEYRAVSQVKVGHAKNFETRQRGYSKCGVDWVLAWEMKLWTPCQALIHETLPAARSYRTARAMLVLEGASRVF